MHCLPLLLLLPALASGSCPFAGIFGGANPHAAAPAASRPLEASEAYRTALAALDLKSVEQDLHALMHTSQDWWPADYGTYAPFFVRLGWHCSGSYRTSDGRGGCAGGRQRFEPEQSWDDNTNLDKARKLLRPLKEKYGLGLSWGDLFIMAANTAIKDMGGPLLGFCAGRVDDEDGTESLELGPTPEQAKAAPCAVNGECKMPLGSTTIGLIYLNPEGPMGKPDPNTTFPTIRDSFGRMAMDDEETVALIGGGHAFGKTHGACPTGAGPKPKDAPLHPWPGTCKDGKGVNAFTSGFEFPWTTKPTSWDNEYFHNLVNFEWEVHIGPGGHNQWRVAASSGAPSPAAPAADGSGNQNIGMLTSDVSLTYDPAYFAIVKRFANDSKAFDDAFSRAWYKLTTRDMGPHSRCTGKDVPPAQPFQYPLPPPADAKSMPSFDMSGPLAADITAALFTAQPGVKAPETIIGKDGKATPYYGQYFVDLAWSCSNTFRHTDFMGGCNGARILQSPEKDWPENAGTADTANLLSAIKTKYNAGSKGVEVLTWADLIVFAGNVAVDVAGGAPMSFCPGRTDAVAGDAGAQYLSSPNFGAGVHNDIVETTYKLKESLSRLGLTLREATVLQGGRHSLGLINGDPVADRAWTTSPGVLDNEWFRNLVNLEYALVDGVTPDLYKAVDGTASSAAGRGLFMSATDMAFISDPVLAGYTVEYAADAELFKADFAAAWTKVMNSDRFDGPTQSLCDRPPRPTAGILIQ